METSLSTRGTATACHPQAWAASAIPYLLSTALGLAPEAFDHRLRVVRPLLPNWTDWVEVCRLRVGTARVDLRFEQAGDRVALKVLAVDGELEVVMEPDAVGPA